MRPYFILLTAAVVFTVAFAHPAEAQRQRSPNGNNGGGRQHESGGGNRQDGGGGRQQQGRAEARAAQPRGDRGGDRGDGGRRESAPPVAREAAPPPQRAEVAQPRAERRQPGNSDRARVDGERASVNGDRRDGDRTGQVRSGSTGRVAVPRQGPIPQQRDGRYTNDGRYYGYNGRNVYRNYGGRNVYIVPRGRTYVYYPRYYYRPYAFGYGPAGRGHFYFDLYYGSYIWHPAAIYRYDTYGSYGYPVGELRLKVHPNDAQVFIDGSYAGRVDEFDGVFQSLRLEAGEYQIEIVMPGFEPLAFNARILPGEKTTYEGDLIPE